MVLTEFFPDSRLHLSVFLWNFSWLYRVEFSGLLWTYLVPSYDVSRLFRVCRICTDLFRVCECFNYMGIARDIGLVSFFSGYLMSGYGQFIPFFICSLLRHLLWNSFWDTGSVNWTPLFCPLNYTRVVSLSVGHTSTHCNLSVGSIFSWGFVWMFMGHGQRSRILHDLSW